MVCSNKECDVQHELGNKAPGAGEVHSESGDDGDSSVDAAERTVSSRLFGKVRAQVRHARSATNRERSYKAHLSTGDPLVAAREPRRAASDGLPQVGDGVEEPLQQDRVEPIRNGFGGSIDSLFFEWFTSTLNNDSDS